MSGWIGVDFDGTLAHYDGWQGPSVLGAPIPAMVARVRQWLTEGKEVRIFTARAYPLGLVNTHDIWIPRESVAHMKECGLQTHNILTAYQAVDAIRNWCFEHLGRVLPITCIKDFSMYELWDDRAIQVEANTGIAYVHPHTKETTP